MVINYYIELINPLRNISHGTDNIWTVYSRLYQQLTIMMLIIIVLASWMIDDYIYNDHL